MKVKNIVLLIILFVLFTVMRCGKEKQKQTEEVKIDYTPIKITEKYPEALQKRDRIMKEIRESIKSQNVYRIKINLANDIEEPCPNDEKESYDTCDKKIYVREKMYDVKNREIYQIEDREAYSKGGGSGARGTGGGIYRYCPEEEGTLYDEKGRVKSKIKVLESENKYSGIEDSGRKSVLRNEERFGDWHSQFTEYKYDEKGNISKEEITMLDVSSELYEKEIKDYENGKVKKSSKVIDCEYPDGNTSLIYVEITKEYDENEKLIKKFVLRKNKFNSVKSETNFDLIKGEIITKYYEGDKVFATVTETLIGKDRAIVKRERVGDEFVIWDLVEYGKKIKNAPSFISDVYDRYIVKNNLITTGYIEILEHGHGYNDTLNKPKGIDKVSYLDERISNKLKDEFAVTSSYQVKEIIVYENNKYLLYTIKEKIPIDLQLRDIEMKIDNMSEYIINKNEVKNTLFNIELIIKKFKEEI